MSARKRGLGRGLDALLATSQSTSQRETDAAATEATQSELSKLPIEFLVPGKYQPRKDMSPDALEDLASSIRAQGVIQPIVVRKVEDNKYEIIAGERRWRASQLAQLDEVPCLVKDVPDEAAVAIALIENIQREDLNAMEEAQALDRLMNEFSLTHQEVAEAVGKSRTTVTNLLRLNNLNDDVKLLVEHGDIEMGHARALLALDGDKQSEAANVVSGKGLTVRDTEKLVKKLLEPEKPKQEKQIDPDVQNLMTRLSENLGAPVTIDHNAKGKGKLVISFDDLQQLDGIITKIQ
ncbi:MULTISPECIES: ParB/RepB/Spo0J family partition protein [Alteromonas]|jgi:ParB family chromosome partitioning protein|uniref:Probable chromosome-partitioning protein ParB n=1 Tax=Alteromonas stellipolaris TaxID=233316 RepID=A0AAW7Z2G1_9ALTE|nr:MULTISPECIES: ParB/RepB/Spo0J family partition protein [Alteromonas]AMJ92498.1 chromosome partitioning protein ParB [Alteromonas sp. Mac2]AMJ88642.1 chromosome partitioning protein ParB [Alteromonas sp. Mac1]MBQ4829354.1 ParB/RepB/Spo0J family partition protein [Alteromonas sp. MMG017]MBZ2160860.1 ParB/RepB/Spo0J family partition protein [Alteromonas stellipolaris]MDO6576668.1 ParB/RepB/Spo0J family partition protein [Alteromonas stellipolaris]